MVENGQNRVSQEEFYPKVSTSTERLKALVPTFGAKIIDAVSEGINSGHLRKADLTLESTGNTPQRLSVSLVGKNSGKELTIVLSGDWERGQEVPEGAPLLANYNGRFWRKAKPDEEDPIAKDRDFIGRDGVIGVASASKVQVWLLRLPPNEFPNGGGINKFLIGNEGEDKKREKNIFYVDKV